MQRRTPFKNTGTEWNRITYCHFLPAGWVRTHKATHFLKGFNYMRQHHFGKMCSRGTLASLSPPHISSGEERKSILSKKNWIWYQKMGECIKEGKNNTYYTYCCPQVRNSMFALMENWVSPSPVVAIHSEIPLPRLLKQYNICFYTHQEAATSRNQLTRKGERNTRYSPQCRTLEGGSEWKSTGWSWCWGLWFFMCHNDSWNQKQWKHNKIDQTTGWNQQQLHKWWS